MRDNWSKSGEGRWQPEAGQWQWEWTKLDVWFQRQSTDEAGDLSVGCVIEAAGNYCILNYEEESVRQRGELATSARSVCVTVLVAFPSQAANTVTQFQSLFSMGEYNTIPSETSEHVKSEQVHSSWLQQPPDNTAKGCCAKRGYSLLSASFSPERRTPGDPGSVKRSTVTISGKFLFDPNDLQWQSNIPLPSNNHCDLHLEWSILSPRTCSKIPSSRLSSCQNMEIHHADRFSPRIPSTRGFEQSILLCEGWRGIYFSMVQNKVVCNYLFLADIWSRNKSVGLLF